VPQAGKRSAVPAAKLLALPSPATEKAADLNYASEEVNEDSGTWSTSGTQK